MHIAPLANPLLTVALGVLLLVCLRHLEAPAPTSRAGGSRNAVAVRVMQGRLFVQSNASGCRGDGNLLAPVPGRGQ